MTIEPKIGTLRIVNNRVQILTTITYVFDKQKHRWEDYIKYILQVRCMSMPPYTILIDLVDEEFPKDIIEVVVIGN